MARVPFFITGSGRSGSTYLYHLLRVHPDIAITNEARIIDALWLAYQAVATPYGSKVPDTEVVGVAHPKTKPVLEDVFRGHLMSMLEEYYVRRFPAGFTHFGDKLPDYCAVAMAAGWCGNIKAILMVRDPRDVVCSYRAVQRHAVPIGLREVKLKNYTVEDLARIWKETYDLLLAEVPHLHTVRYRDLVTKPAENVGRVLEFLGLPFHPAVSEAIASNDTITGHGTSRNAQASIGRWKEDLSANEAKLVTTVCGPLMERLGIPL